MTEAKPHPTYGQIKEVLSPKQRERAGRRFMAVAERVPEMQEQMKAAGFAAFTVFQAYEQARHSRFLKTIEEREIQARYEVETLKFWCSLHSYHSAFLRERHEQRLRENGCPDHEVEQKHPDELWRMYDEPLRRNERKYFAGIDEEQRQAYERDRLAMLERAREACRQEVAKHDLDLSKAYGYGPDDDKLQLLEDADTGEIFGATKNVDQMTARAELYLAAMEKYGGPLGFSHNPKLSRQTYPVFSKSLGKDRFLAFVLHDARQFVMGSGTLHLELEIRSSRHKGRLSGKGEAECFTIRAFTVILPGFFQAYLHFDSQAEAEMLIKANMTLYSLIAPDLEKGLAAASGHC